MGAPRDHSIQHPLTHGIIVPASSGPCMRLIGPRTTMNPPSRAPAWPASLSRAATGTPRPGDARQAGGAGNGTPPETLGDPVPCRAADGGAGTPSVARTAMLTIRVITPEGTNDLDLLQQLSPCPTVAHAIPVHDLATRQWRLESVQLRGGCGLGCLSPSQDGGVAGPDNC